MSPVYRREAVPVLGELPESRVVERYNPQLYTRGYEHVVYRLPEHPEVVIKVSAHKIIDILAENYSGETAPSDAEIAEKVAHTYKEEIESKNREARQLREFFGDEHTLQERRLLAKVPVTPQILRELHKGDYKKRKVPSLAKNLQEVWTHIIVQGFASGVADPNRLTFSFGGYSEEKRISAKAYADITHKALDARTADIDKERFLKVQDSSPERFLGELLKKAETDSALRRTLVDFIERTITFTESTGQILALAGKDNVIFSQKGGVWTYTLIDATPIPVEPIFDSTKNLEEKITIGASLTGHGKGLLLRTLNFVRAINGVAIILGVSQRLNVPDAFKSVDFLPIFKQK